MTVPVVTVVASDDGMPAWVSIATTNKIQRSGIEFPVEVLVGTVADAVLFKEVPILRNLSGNSSWKAGHRPEQTTAATEPAPDTGSTETIPADTSADEEGGTPDVQ